MKRTVSGVVAAATLAASALTATAPAATANPYVDYYTECSRSNPIGCDRQGFIERDRRNWERDRAPRSREPEFRMRGNVPWYNGHRGYRERHPGYRQYNGFWFPAIAFGIIAGATIQDHYDSRYEDRRGSRYAEPVPDAVWRRHVNWCYDNYKSYRESDNSFQPYEGPRKYCKSPYL